MPPIAFRSRFTMVLCVVAWAALAVVLGIVVATPGDFERGGVALGMAALAALVWAVLWSPRVVVDDTEVTIENVVSTVRIPWAALIQVETRYSLTLHTPGRVFSATAAPAPGQLSGLNAARSERRRGQGAGSLIRPGDLASTDSGRAADLVRSRWERLRDSGAIEAGVADATEVQVHPRVTTIVTIVLAVAALVASVLSS